MSPKDLAEALSPLERDLDLLRSWVAQTEKLAQEHNKLCGRVAKLDESTANAFALGRFIGAATCPACKARSVARPEMGARRES